jgi:hypothetical protein
MSLGPKISLSAAFLVETLTTSWWSVVQSSLLSCLARFLRAGDITHRSDIQRRRVSHENSTLTNKKTFVESMAGMHHQQVEEMEVPSNVLRADTIPVSAMLCRLYGVRHSRRSNTHTPAMELSNVEARRRDFTASCGSSPRCDLFGAAWSQILSSPVPATGP